MMAPAASWPAPEVPELLLSTSKGGTNPKVPACLSAEVPAYGNSNFQLQ